MTRKEAYIIAAVVVFFFVVIAGGAAYYVVRSQAQLQQIITDQNEVIKASQKKGDDAGNQKQVVEKQEDSRTSDLARALAQLASAKTQPVDLDELARRIREQMGTTAQIEKPQANLPNAPSAVTLPAKPLRDYMTDCDAAKTGWSSCNDGLKNKDKIIADQVTQLSAKDDELVATRKQRDAAVKVSKGGGFLSRVRGGIKHSICGSGGTGAGFGAASVSNPQYGMIAGVATFGACELVLK